MGPAPGRTFPTTPQLGPVSAPGDTRRLSNVTTLSSKVKSPWNLTRLSAASIADVTTGCMKVVRDVSMVATGKETVAIRIGAGVGVDGAVAVAVAVVVVVA